MKKRLLALLLTGLVSAAMLPGALAAEEDWLILDDEGWESASDSAAADSVQWEETLDIGTVSAADDSTAGDPATDDGSADEQLTPDESLPPDGGTAQERADTVSEPVIQMAAVGKPTIKKLSYSSSNKKFYLTYTAPSAADRVRIQVYNVKTGKKLFQSVRKDRSASVTYSKSDFSFQAGGKYEFRLAARQTVKGKSAYGAVVTKTVSIALPEIATFKAANTSETANKITWSKVSGAANYLIAFSTSKNGTYKTLAKPKASATSYTHSNLTLGKTYYYKLWAVSSSGVKSPVRTGSAATTLTKVKSLKSAKLSTPQLKLTWSKHSYATGYLVQYSVHTSSSATPTYNKSRTVAQSSAPSLTLNSVNGRYYFFKVIPYRTVNGKKLLGREATLSRWVNHYAYEDESWDDKWQRIYGSLNSAQYTTAAQAEKNMTTISVKVWDFKSGQSGQKVTRTMYLTVHKNIAPTVKKIFQEIYSGKEKAPIYSVGGYSWRTGEHSQGLAIDINPDYNYFVTHDGEILEGSCWKPSKYPYSIKRNGDIENTFRKYGFSRGFWSTKTDYMHFSYFGT